MEIPLTLRYTLYFFRHNVENIEQRIIILKFAKISFKFVWLWRGYLEKLLFVLFLLVVLKKGGVGRESEILNKKESHKHLACIRKSGFNWTKDVLVWSHVCSLMPILPIWGRCWVQPFRSILSLFGETTRNQKRLSTEMCVYTIYR